MHSSHASPILSAMTDHVTWIEGEREHRALLADVLSEPAPDHPHWGAAVARRLVLQSLVPDWGAGAPAGVAEAVAGDHLPHALGAKPNNQSLTPCQKKPPASGGFS